MLTPRQPLHPHPLPRVSCPALGQQLAGGAGRCVIWEPDDLGCPGCCETPPRELWAGHRDRDGGTVPTDTVQRCARPSEAPTPDSTPWEPVTVVSRTGKVSWSGARAQVCILPRPLCCALCHPPALPPARCPPPGCCQAQNSWQSVQFPRIQFQMCCPFSAPGASLTALQTFSTAFPCLRVAEHRGTGSLSHLNRLTHSGLCGGGASRCRKGPGPAVAVLAVGLLPIGCNLCSAPHT